MFPGQDACSRSRFRCIWTFEPEQGGAVRHARAPQWESRDAIAASQVPSAVREARRTLHLSDWTAPWHRRCSRKRTEGSSVQQRDWQEKRHAVFAHVVR
jgi:hypothetical protein